MPESPQTTIPQKVSSATATAYRTALAATYKALKAYTFYPEGHPLRDRILAGAHQAVASAAKGGALSVLVSRNGFTCADGRTPVPSTPMTKALVQELFAREIQRLNILVGVTLADYLSFLSLLSLDPPRLLASGGLARLMQQQGIINITLNEIDISAVFTKVRGEQDAEGAEDGSAPGSGSTASAQGSATPGSGSAFDYPGVSTDRLNQLSVSELVELMAQETDDDKYRQIGRILLVKVQPLRQERDFDALFCVLVALLEQHSDPTRLEPSRDEALVLLRQLSAGDLTEHLLDHLEDGEFTQKELVFLILKTIGPEAVDPVIRRLIAVGLKAARRTLSTALLRIGAPAEPALIALLKDGRWQVALSAASILGELGSREAVKGLSQAAVQHNDSRVRLEAIRALALIGGKEANVQLLAFLNDPNPAVAQHTALWLGNTKNARAVDPLWQLVQRRDLRGKLTPLKKEALLAIGRIGDRRALEPLDHLLRRRFILFPGRWNELKLVALEAIGTLGGEQARQSLSRTAELGGHLGRVASAVLDAMAKRNTEHHE
ncbi:PBS lyase [Geomonas limicola]|uniref:PBS lyase n=1 Tax=Geomonas limicola TaxID=2740186 RepID=A0A6V8N2Y9_9BACT|nr:HEAT repeat domain-containing protein [Geomonas limicola]GFO66801.1 PBS lyase [Geomonas limicola]